MRLTRLAFHVLKTLRLPTTAIPIDRVCLMLQSDAGFIAGTCKVYAALDQLQTVQFVAASGPQTPRVLWEITPKGREYLREQLRRLSQ